MLTATDDAGDVKGSETEVTAPAGRMLSINFFSEIIIPPIFAASCVVRGFKFWVVFSFWSFREICSIVFFGPKNFIPVTGESPMISVTVSWIKISQSCPISVPRQFLLENWCFQNSLERLQSIWATFVRKFVTKNFQKFAQSGHTANDTCLQIG